MSYIKSVLVQALGGGLMHFGMDSASSNTRMPAELEHETHQICNMLLVFLFCHGHQIGISCQETIGSPLLNLMRPAFGIMLSCGIIRYIAVDS